MAIGPIDRSMVTGGIPQTGVATSTERVSVHNDDPSPATIIGFPAVIRPRPVLSVVHRGMSTATSMCSSR